GLVSRSPSINWIGTESDSRSAPRAAGPDWHQGEERCAAILERVAGSSESLATSAHLIANRSNSWSGYGSRGSSPLAPVLGDAAEKVDGCVPEYRGEGRRPFTLAIPFLSAAQAKASFRQQLQAAPQQPVDEHHRSGHQQRRRGQQGVALFLGGPADDRSQAEG